jgi:hypothetical protein
MIRIFLLLPLFLLARHTQAQELSHIHFIQGTTLSSFFFTTDQQVIIKISPEGNVLEWGMEWEPWRYNYQPGKLLPYMGRVAYYGSEADSVSKGKVKTIGTTMFSYYPASETPAKAGKLRSIGSVALDYYSSYDNAALSGKLRSAGHKQFNYYYAHENEAFRGKLKTVGTSTITYYSTFDDKLIKGKVKSIDGISYGWYTSYESRYGGGGLKSGTITRKINGVTYIVM